MTNPRETALALAVVTTIADAAKERKDQLRYQLLEELNNAGADAVRAEIDGKRVARTSLITPQDKLVIQDEEAFAKWVQQNYPTEVETITTIRPVFRELFLKGLIRKDGNFIDPRTGELVPHIKATPGNAYVSTRFEPEGRAEILEALRNQTIALDLTADMPALEAGNS